MFFLGNQVKKKAVLLFFGFLLSSVWFEQKFPDMTLQGADPTKLENAIQQLDSQTNRTSSYGISYDRISRVILVGY